jgi:hypothetical protein
MAERYSNPFVRYFDTNAALLNGGKLNFYVDDGGTTRKNTYSDDGLTTANTNPVVLTASGVVPDIFLSGAYKVVLTDVDDVQIDAANNVNVTGFTVDDSNNNTVTDVITMTHTTSGTPAAGIGTGLAYVTETAAGNNETGMTIDAVTTDVSGGSEDFDFVVNLMAAGVAAVEKLRVSSVGILTAVGKIIPGGDTSAGDAAAIGVTDAEGIIITGQGSTSDITLKNDADAIVASVPTGTQIFDLSTGGAYFGTAAAANLLDDYEEGTFTFLVEDASNNNITYSGSSGTYTKIGQLVTFNLAWTTSGLLSASGGLRVDGLPFVVSGDGSAVAGTGTNLNITAGYNITGDCVNGSDHMNIKIWDGAAGATELTAAELSADGSLQFGGHYITAS